MAIEYEWCPLCREGYTIVRGVIKECGACEGTGLLTPGTICFCGKSCSWTQESINYCGNADCLKELSRIPAPDDEDEDTRFYPGGEYLDDYPGEGSAMWLARRRGNGGRFDA